MTILRTPEPRFAELPEYPFASHYLELAHAATPLRIHYLDEGPRGAPVVLMLHGEPTWSFLYRKVIGAMRDAPLRIVVPDLIGFGRSDKFADRSAYTYERHVGWAHAFIRALELQQITLLCQDWGGLIGLRLVAEHPELFARVVVANTSLPTGDREPPEAFRAWQRQSQAGNVFPAGEIVAQYCSKPLTAAAKRAYDAPFPEERYAAAARAFPLLVPIAPDDPASPANRSAWERLVRFERPFLTVFGDSDPFSSGVERLFQRKIPGAAGQPHRVLSGVGHFIQEDAGEELGRITAAFALPASAAQRSRH